MVLFTGENGFPAIPSRHQVINRTRILESQRSRCGKIHTRQDATVRKYLFPRTAPVQSVRHLLKYLILRAILGGMEVPAVVLVKRNGTPSGVGKLFFQTPGSCGVGHGKNPFLSRPQPVANQARGLACDLPGRTSTSGHFRAARSSNRSSPARCQAAARDLIPAVPATVCSPQKGELNS